MLKSTMMLINCLHFLFFITITTYKYYFQLTATLQHLFQFKQVYLYIQPSFFLLLIVHFYLSNIHMFYHLFSINYFFFSEIILSYFCICFCKFSDLIVFMIIDLTQSFRNLIPQHYLQQEAPPKNSLSIQSQLCNKHAQDIIMRLNRISSILQQNKQNYFSNAAYSYSAFTDQQRNQFDNQMKTLLDSVNNKISEIREVVQGVKFQTTTQKQHLKNVVICLYQMFKNMSNTFRQFIEFNQNRKKKLQNMLGNQIKKQYKTVFNENKARQKQKNRINLPNAREGKFDEQLEKEAKLLFMQKMSEQKKIQQTMKKLSQIGQILNVMQNKVLEQQLLTSSFREIGEVGLFHIQKGNKNLIEANTLSKDSGRLWTMFFLFLALSLLTLDYLKS